MHRQYEELKSQERLEIIVSRNLAHLSPQALGRAIKRKSLSGSISGQIRIDLVLVVNQESGEIVRIQNKLSEDLQSPYINLPSVYCYKLKIRVESLEFDLELQHLSENAKEVLAMTAEKFNNLF